MVQEEFEDTKGASESIYRTDNTMAKKKVQKDKQGSTKHTHKTKDWVAGTPWSHLSHWAWKDTTDTDKAASYLALHIKMTGRGS